ncbi:MAG TPA: gluconokinase [Anaerolineales bacterium]|nr:gluconokinase [Anaerolineales bacterium]
MSENEHSDWFLGIDLGTGSCKSIIVDEQARQLGFGAGSYARRETTGKWDEQDPQELLSAMIQSVRSAIQDAGVDPSACQAFSIGGAYHSLIAVDKSDKPLTGVITWVDDRAMKQAQAVRDAQQAVEIYKQTGCPVHGMYPLYKMIWMREEQPQIFQQATRFISAKEYVTKQLIGDYLVDIGIAAGSALLNTNSFAWNPLSLDLAGIRPDQLSPLVDPRQVVKGLRAELAAQMGIPKETPLVLGSADAVNSSLGAGAVLPGQATCMIGTSGAFRIIAPRPMLDEQARTWCYAIDEGHWLVGGAINNGGLALTWLRDALNQLMQTQTNETRITFDDLVASALQIPPGADGLICLPFFAGERSPYWNMKARGVFFGLTLSHDARHMARALMEGVGYRLRSIRDVLDELGTGVHEIRASGGFTHSDLWPQIIASVLNHDLTIPASGETSSLGAAFWALLGSDVVERFEDLHSLVEITKTYSPKPKEADLYDSLYRIYMELYFQLGKLFDQISLI